MCYPSGKTFSYFLMWKLIVSPVSQPPKALLTAPAERDMLVGHRLGGEETKERESADGQQT